MSCLLPRVANSLPIKSAVRWVERSRERLSKGNEVVAVTGSPIRSRSGIRTALRDHPLIHEWLLFDRVSPMKHLHGVLLPDGFVNMARGSAQAPTDIASLVTITT